MPDSRLINALSYELKLNLEILEEAGVAVEELRAAAAPLQALEAQL